MTGVSFVVPVHGGEAHLARTIDSIAAQADGRPMEIVVVDDGGRAGSAAAIQSLALLHPMIVVEGPRRGAAAAVNAGVRRASHPIICQVDQDVVLQPGWMVTLLAALDDGDVAAAQGRYAVDARASFFSRVMALDLEQRYLAVGERSNHVCTGNTAYRASALHEVGLLDETLGYGYDNDLSYRLQAAGYRLAFCREARSLHRWRDGLAGYLVQQYGFGYGRLDVVARHPARCAGDAVSPALMMAHPVVMAAALSLVAAGALASSATAMAAGVALLAALMCERAMAGVQAWKSFGDRAALAFPLVHLARDLAWLAAIAAWGSRRLAGRPFRPQHSMKPRTGTQ
jgi:cellulose synthase/poly-beta-1,6-N-acetylglucosamine synthase-like glycosyltransferase